MKNKIIAIIQARMGSHRLPGKVFMKLGGHPILWHVIKRISSSRLINQTIVATTTNPEDDEIAQYCQANSVPIYRGSSNDVLSRYYETAFEFDASNIVRITSDCPVIDPDIIDDILTRFRTANENSRKLDYLSNTVERTYARGLDVEVFSFIALKRAHREADKPHEREHVTPYIYQNPDKFNISQFTDAVDRSGYRWTVDTKEDLELLQAIYRELYNENEIFRYNDILNLMNRKPELSLINMNVDHPTLPDSK